MVKDSQHHLYSNGTNLCLLYIHVMIAQEYVLSSFTSVSHWSQNTKVVYQFSRYMTTSLLNILKLYNEIINYEFIQSSMSVYNLFYLWNVLFKVAIKKCITLLVSEFKMQSSLVHWIIEMEILVLSIMFTGIHEPMNAQRQEKTVNTLRTFIKYRRSGKYFAKYLSIHASATTIDNHSALNFVDKNNPMFIYLLFD